VEALITDEDIEVLLDDMVQQYGYDFTEYSKALLSAGYSGFL
jgi:hypothetical protein